MMAVFTNSNSELVDEYPNNEVAAVRHSHRIHRAEAMMYVLVSGYRDWTDEETIWFELDLIREKYRHNMMVIQGGCTGADQMAVEWCKHNEIPYLTWPARWNTGAHGKGEGPKRNRAMVDWLYGILFSLYGSTMFNHKCLAFLDDKSRGTRDAISYMKDVDLNLKVIAPKGKVIAEYKRSS